MKELLLRWKYLTKNNKRWIIFGVLVLIPLIVVALLFALALSPFIFLGITVICLVIAVFKKHARRRLLIRAGIAFGLAIGSAVAITMMVDTEEATLTPVTPPVVEAQGEEVGANVYHENETFNQLISNLNTHFDLALTKADLKPGTTRLQMQLTLGEVRVEFIETQTQLFVDLQVKNVADASSIVTVFAQILTAGAVDLTNAEFQTMVEALLTQAATGFQPYVVNNATFSFGKSETTTGQYDLTLQSEIPHELLFKQAQPVQPFEFEMSVTWPDVSVEAETPEVTTPESSQPSVNAESTATAETVLHFIDTGNSDAILLENSGKFALIDSGDRDDDATVTAYLKQAGVSELEYLIITHFHADHLGAADRVVEQFKVKTTLVPNGSATTQVYQDFILALANQGLAASVPLEQAQLPLGTAMLTMYNTQGGQANENDNSLVTLVTSGQRKALLTGDAESGIEATLTHIGDVDVFKAGHHGSKTSNSETLLTAITPEHIVMTVGANNSYGHPAAEVMSRFKAKGIPVYRNDEQGTIVVRLTPEAVEMSHAPASYTPGGGGTTSSTTQPSVETQSSVEAQPSTPTNQGTSEVFANCTELKKVYPSGVGADHPAYQAKMDRDKDNWACE